MAFAGLESLDTASWMVSQGLKVKLHVAHDACIAFHFISYHVVSYALFFPQAPPFRPALSREFQPYKPHAAPLLHICDTWGANPKEVLIIGDSHKDDVS